jgi:hypothetical protein
VIPGSKNTQLGKPPRAVLQEALPVMTKKKVLVIEYDVTELTAKQIDNLMLEAVAASDRGHADESYPDVPVIGTKVVSRGGKS